MDGTCVETPEVRPPGGEDEEPVIFTFYWDVAANPTVIKTMLSLNHGIQKIISGVNRYVDGWRKHQGLWKQERGQILDKFAAKNPSCSEFEEKLAKYKKIAKDIWDLPKFKDIDVVRVAAASLVA
jgi:dynein heavy chain